MRFIKQFVHSIGSITTYNFSTGMISPASFNNSDINDGAGSKPNS